MRMSWTWAAAALLVTTPALGETGGLLGPSFAPLSAPAQDAPIARSASRMFPHGHPLHICGDAGGGWNWLEGGTPPNPWSSLTERARATASSPLEWSSESRAAH